jgi:AcrR family transcriptional regulator
MTEPSRRDRKRAAVQDALHATALRLFAERGYAQTTIADITDAVDVSERTFFRYFPTKEDVLLHDLRQVRPRLLAALAARPAAEPPLRAILAAILTLRRDGGGRLYRSTTLLPRGTDLTAQVPSARLLQIFAEWEAGLIATLLARAGVDEPGERDLLRAEVTARAALAALRTALTRYRAMTARGVPPIGTFIRLVTEAFEVLEQGFGPAPGRGRAAGRGTADCAR